MSEAMAEFARTRLYKSKIDEANLYEDESSVMSDYSIVEEIYAKNLYNDNERNWTKL